MSLFAHTLGIKAFAAKGKVEIQAQSDEMHLSSLKDMTITSTGGKTVIAAKATNWVVEGAASMDVTHPQFPQSMPKQTLRFQLSSSPQSPMKARAFEPYTLYANGALLTQGVTDENGNIQIEHDVSIEKYRVELMDGENFDIHLQPEKDESDEEDAAQQGFRVIEPPPGMRDKSDAGSPHKSVFHRLLNPLLSPDDTTK